MSGTRGAFDVLIVGGGHNGLVCAAYLGGAGLRVCVLERRSILGGAAVTESFHPGFRNSTASYAVSLLAPRIVRDLRLAEHGLRIVPRPLANFLPLPDGRALRVGGGLAATQADVARFSRRDAERLPAYYAMLGRVADVVRELLPRTPPNAGTPPLADPRALLDGIRALRRFRALGLSGQRDALDLATKSAGDILDRWFESAPVKAAFGFDAIVGHYASPYTPGSAGVLLHLALGEIDGRRGQWGHAIGGMGSITDAMARECRARAVVLRTDAPVAEVLVRDGRVAGVALEGGETIVAPRVAAGVNPRLLFTRLIAREHLDTDFLGRIEAYRCASGTFRMNVALSELPDFLAAPGKAPAAHHGSGIVIGPSLEYMERAYFDARSTGWSRAPIVELVIPSVIDATLAPPGMHVASLFCQHVHPELQALVPGRTWDAAREEVADLVIDTVGRYAPNFRSSVIARRSLSPLDLEREFGLVGGDIYHGALSLDQLWSARPVLGHANYRMPIRNLYLCGAGAHPGGGVTGFPGFNAAREILRDTRRHGRAPWIVTRGDRA